MSETKDKEILELCEANIKLATQINYLMNQIIYLLEKADDLYERTFRNEKDICAIGDTLTLMNNQEKKAIKREYNAMMVDCPACKGEGRFKMVHPE